MAPRISLFSSTFTQDSKSCPRQHWQTSCLLWNIFTFVKRCCEKPEGMVSVCSALHPLTSLKSNQPLYCVCIPAKSHLVPVTCFLMGACIFILGNGFHQTLAPVASNLLFVSALASCHWQAHASWGGALSTWPVTSVAVSEMGLQCKMTVKLLISVWERRLQPSDF